MLALVQCDAAPMDR